MRKHAIVLTFFLVVSGCDGSATPATPARTVAPAETQATVALPMTTVVPATTLVPRTTMAPTATKLAPAISYPPSEWTSEQINTRRSELLAFFDSQAPSGVTNAQRSAVPSLVKRARWAVVEIVVEDSAQGTGTFISSDGYLVTAGHVVNANGDHTVITYDGRQLPATLVAHNSSAPDIAILKVDGDGFPFVPIGSTPSAGDFSAYVGHPSGLLWIGTGGVVTGIVRDDSVADPSEALDLIHITNPSNQGASGSAILSLDGDLIGLISGERGNPLPESVIDVSQNKSIWSASDFHELLDNTRFGPTAGVVVEFIEKHVPGLVQANRATRNDAVTIDPDFVAPSIPSELCRICLHWSGLMDWLVDHVVDIPPIQEILYLEMIVASLKEPDNVTVEERVLVRSVGQEIQSAVVEVSVPSSGNAGTGVFISSDGYLITNAHIVESAQAIEVTTFDDRTLAGTVVGSVSEDWVPDLALVKINTKNEAWVPLAAGASYKELVVGVGHPQGLKWAIYGGRVSFWDTKQSDGILQIPEFQADSVNVGIGSSGSPVVNMRGELIGVIANGMSDHSFSSQWSYGASNLVESVVFWDQASLNAAFAGRLGGPRVDVVRDFIEAQVPGLLGR